MIKASLNLRGEKYPDDKLEGIWIHIGDDLALEVGGSTTVSTKTIGLNLNTCNTKESLAKDGIFNLS